MYINKNIIYLRKNNLYDILSIFTFKDAKLK